MGTRVSITTNMLNSTVDKLDGMRHVLGMNRAAFIEMAVLREINHMKRNLDRGTERTERHA